MSESEEGAYRTKKCKSPRYDPVLPPCKVCGAKASGYHFGAITCEACKVFFRRSLNKENDYKCTKDGKCQILSVRRMSCSYCRLRKCKEQGMSRDGIQKGRYTLEKKTDCIREAQESNAQKQTMSGIPGVKLPPQTVSYSKPPKKDSAIESLIQYMVKKDLEYPLYSEELIRSLPEREENYRRNEKMRFKLFGPMRPIPHETYKEIYSITGIDLDGRKEEISQCISHGDAEIIPLVNFAKSLPGFKEICMEDQLILLKVTSFYWWQLSSMEAINLEHCLFTCPSCGTTLGYDDMLKWISQDTIIEWCRFVQFFKSLHMSKEELALLKGISVLDTDYCKGHLKDQATIDKHREKLMAALKYYIDRTYGVGKPKRFTQMMQALRDSQDALVEYQKMMERWFEVWPDLDCPPLMKELLSDFPYNVQISSEISGSVSGNTRCPIMSGKRSYMNSEIEVSGGDINDTGLREQRELEYTDINGNRKQNLNMRTQLSPEHVQSIYEHAHSGSEHVQYSEHAQSGSEHMQYSEHAQSSSEHVQFSEHAQSTSEHVQFSEHAQSVPEQAQGFFTSSAAVLGEVSSTVNDDYSPEPQNLKISENQNQCYESDNISPQNCRMYEHQSELIDLSLPRKSDTSKRDISVSNGGKFIQGIDMQIYQSQYSPGSNLSSVSSITALHSLSSPQSTGYSTQASSPDGGSVYSPVPRGPPSQ